ncbi:hypothetical protein [Mesorhizobium temperatum]|uniref:hypothetical protein n=1 Tax=Mesorhizobium temperatum TaxID=241416 RepID=UPI00117FEE9D|nr:hypothetical protein [Mesorhizobium temperatum]
MRKALAVFVLMLSSPALAESPLCSMSKADALISTQCVRWFFACNGRTLGEPDPRFASLPYKTRLRLVAEAIFEVAEEQCFHFEYAQAKAALDARLLQIGE